MANLREKLSNLLTATFKSKDKEEIKNIADIIIDECGAESMDDLQLLKLEDLSLLKSLERRKLLLACSCHGSKLNRNINYICNDSQEKNPTGEQSFCQKSAAVPSNWLVHFKVPWHRMPKDLMKSLEEKKCPDPRLQREMIRIVVDEIRRYTVLHREKALNTIATTMVHKYPESLMDMINGQVLLEGKSSTVKQLRNRVENFNRGQNAQKRKAEVLENNSNKRQSDSANKASEKCGCINWQPPLPPHETAETQEEKRCTLIAHYNNGPANYNADFIRDLITDTCYTQREEISNHTSLSELLERWSCLFTTAGLIAHSNLLLNIDVESKLKEFLEHKAEKIIACFKTLPKGCYKKQLSEALNAMQVTEKPAILIKLICAYFGEKSDTLFRVVEISRTGISIQQIVDIPKTPCLFACGVSSLSILLKEQNHPEERA